MLNFASIEFPITLKDILNLNISTRSINVYSIDVYSTENEQILHLWLINDKKEKHVNMLYMQDLRNDILT